MYFGWASAKGDDSETFGDRTIDSELSNDVLSRLAIVIDKL